MEIIDRKFKFHATNPFNGHTYDETNAVVFCAKDEALPVALYAYREQCKKIGANEEHIISIGLLLERVLEFQRINGSRVPDTIGDEAKFCLGVTS